MKFTQVTHYASNDPERSSDYLSIELLDEDGKPILSFIDAYHEDGRATIEGFVQGVEYATGQPVELIEQEIADGPEQDW